jgi:hypothetical protein
MLPPELAPGCLALAAWWETCPVWIPPPAWKFLGTATNHVQPLPCERIGILAAGITFAFSVPIPSYTGKNMLKRDSDSDSNPFG